MIEQRTMLRPGEGIVRDEEPVTEQKRYPLVMNHPAYQPGVPDKEIKIMDEATGKWTGFLRYEGHQAIRFPPVLVHTESDENAHAAQGYVPGQTCTPAEFAKYVQKAMPPINDYKPVEYPKWVKGKLVNSAEEEADLIDLMGMQPLSSEAPAAEPSASAEVYTLKDKIEITAAAETKEERIARLKRELAELEEVPAEGVGQAPRESEPEVRTHVAPSVPDAGSGQSAEDKRKARSDAIKAGLARRKAEKAANAA